MKTTKKVLAFLIVAMMIVAMLPSALATITVENKDPDYDENTSGETYVAYKIFDAVRSDGNPNAVTYKISTGNPFFSILFAVDEEGTATAKPGNTWFTATKLDDSTYVIVPAADFNSETKAIEAAKWLNANKGSASGITLNVGPNTVDDGYYLITSSLGCNLGLATTEIPMSIVEKNKYPTIDKKQNDKGADASYSDEDVSVQVGDTIWYEVIVYVPATADKVLTVTDTMSSGITFDYDAETPFTVKIGDSDFSFTETPAEGAWSAQEKTAQGWKIILDPSKIIDAENPQDKYVEIKFAVTVDEDAIIDSTKQNDVDLTYSNFAQSDHVNYVVYATGAVKYDGATADVGENGTLTPKSEETAIKYLSGAEFKLQVNGVDLAVVKDEAGGFYRPAVTGETGVPILSDGNGEIIIRGLDTDKTYTLVETKAPDGYNLLTESVPLTLTLDAKSAVTISGEADDTTTTKLTASAVAKIANNQGNLLPSTGGMGTTLFYVLGSILVIGAVVLLVSKKRMNAAE